ncbi:MOP flippase family protein [Alteromonas sp. MTD1]|uniref:MOP flippase family protein n=1 Tax=Alteromonas sp. MTD1 TaxID=3057962 RepID=UPI0036F27447
MNLKASAIAGVKWTSVSLIIATLIQFLQLSILARYLRPDEFGIMAIIVVVIGFSQAFMDMGISKAIVQRQDVTSNQLSSLYWLNVFSGCLLSIVVFATAPLLGSFYENNDISELIYKLSPVFLITAFGNQYRVLCQKTLQFNLLAFIDLTSAVLSFCVAITLAVNGGGVDALVYAMLTNAVSSSILLLFIGVRNYQRPKFRFNHSEVKSFYSFGFFQMGERSINYVSANLDKMLIGKMIGLQSVGFYNMAWQLVAFPLAKINPVVNKVAFPIYSKIQNDNALLNKYYSLSIRLLGLITVPILIFLATYSNDVVFIVFGYGWEESASLVRLLAVIGIYKALSNPGGALLLALGRADIGFYWNVFWVTSIAGTLYFSILYFQTVDAVCFALLLLNFTIGLIWHLIVAKVGKIHYFDIFVQIMKTVVSTGVIVLLSIVVVFLLHIETALMRVLIGGLFCVILYTMFVITFERSLLRLLKKE